MYVPLVSELSARHLIICWFGVVFLLQSLVDMFFKLESERGAFLVFGDLSQRAWMSERAREIGLRCSPDGFVWEKTNKSPFYNITALNPGCTYVCLLRS